MIDVLFRNHPRSIACFRALEQAMLARHPEAVLRVQKTCASFLDPGPFCYISPGRTADGSIIVTFGLDAPILDPRIIHLTEVRPNRWTHHVSIHSPEQIDDQLLAWIDWAHAFKIRTKRGGLHHAHHHAD